MLFSESESAIVSFLLKKELLLRDESMLLSHCVKEISVRNVSGGGEGVV